MSLSTITRNWNLVSLLCIPNSFQLKFIPLRFLRIIAVYFGQKRFYIKNVFVGSQYSINENNPLNKSYHSRIKFTPCISLYIYIFTIHNHQTFSLKINCMPGLNLSSILVCVSLKKKQ